MTQPPPPRSAASEQESAASNPGKRPAQRFLAVILLCGAAALATYAVQAWRQIESVEARVAVNRLSEPTELAARQHDVIGTFATGAAPGDRTLMVTGDGKIEFIEIGADPATGRITDTYYIARRGKNFSLVTKSSGLVDVVNIDTMVHYRDTYRRTR